MNLNIAGQYRTALQEKEELKRRLAVLERRFVLLEKYLKHTSDIKKSREQAQKGKLISQEKLFRALGF